MASPEETGASSTTSSSSTTTSSSPSSFSSTAAVFAGSLSVLANTSVVPSWVIFSFPSFRTPSADSPSKVKVTVDASLTFQVPSLASPIKSMTASPPSAKVRVINMSISAIISMSEVEISSSPSIASSCQTPTKFAAESPPSLFPPPQAVRPTASASAKIMEAIAPPVLVFMASLPFLQLRGPDWDTSPKSTIAGEWHIRKYLTAQSSIRIAPMWAHVSNGQRTNPAGILSPVRYSRWTPPAQPTSTSYHTRSSLGDLRYGALPSPH